MPTKKTKVEDKWWRMRDEFHKVEMLMQATAVKLANKAGLSDVAIGKTPLEWYYFIKGVRRETEKVVPKVRKVVTKDIKIEFEDDDRSLEEWSKIILGR